MDAVSVDAGADGSVRVALRGEIDFTNAAPVTEVIQEAVTRHRPTAVRVDLTDVTFLDSSGIAVLVNAMQAAENAGASYQVVHPNPKVVDQLRMTGLLAAFGLAEPSGEG